MATKYLARDEKKMLKESVISALTLRIPATPKVYDLIWNYEDCLLWFFSTLKSANDEFILNPMFIILSSNEKESVSGEVFPEMKSTGRFL